jgi:hypothetical protein
MKIGGASRIAREQLTFERLVGVFAAYLVAQVIFMVVGGFAIMELMRVLWVHQVITHGFGYGPSVAVAFWLWVIVTVLCFAKRGGQEDV